MTSIASAADGARSMSAPADIPQILHFTWKTREIPRRYRPLVEGWARRHPGWTRRIWTDRDLRGDWPGASVFLRRGDAVFHTYSTYARGLDHTAVGYPFLDLTPFGRQEPWEDSPPGWPQSGLAAGMPHE